MQGQRAVGYPRQPAYPRPDHDAGALAVIFAVREPARILDRLGRGRQRIDDKPVHLALILRSDPIIGIEQPRGGVATRHLGGDPRWQI